MGHLMTATRRTLLPLALALAAVPLAALATTPSGPRARGEARSVAVVDLFRVLKEAEPFVKAEAELRAWIEAEKKNLQGFQDDLERKQTELKLFQPDGPEYFARKDEVEQLQLRFRQAYDARERERERRIIANQRRSFEDSRRAIAEAAAASGVDIVLQLRAGDPSGKRPDEVTSEIYLRDVLYHDPALDITVDVLRILNR